MISERIESPDGVICEIAEGDNGAIAQFVRKVKKIFAKNFWNILE